MCTDKSVKNNLAETCVTYRRNASHILVGLFKEERRSCRHLRA